MAIVLFVVFYGTSTIDHYAQKNVFRETIANTIEFVLTNLQDIQNSNK